MQTTVIRKTFCTDMKYNQDHPIHMHGYKYYVVAMGTVGDNVSMVDIETLNSQGLLAKQLTGAPATDTITVPCAGYVVVRFRATNPGQLSALSATCSNVSVPYQVMLTRLVLVLTGVQLLDELTQIVNLASSITRLGNLGRTHKIIIY